MQKELTIFYSKRNGKIKTFCSGIQTFDMFMDDKEDMELICNKMVIEYDDFFVRNYNMFRVVDGEVILEQPINYKIK